MKSKKNTFLKKITINALPIFLLVGLSSLSFFSQQKDRYQSLNEGIYTCFTRVGQSYTAKLLGHQNSPYLQDDFTKTSQECFAEGIELAQRTSLFTSIKIRQSLNNLASETHWLHQSFKKSEGVAVKLKGAEDNSISLNSRFAALEKMRDKTIDLVDDQVASISSYQMVTTILTFSLTFLAAFVLWSLRIISSESTSAKSKMKKPEDLLTEEIPLFNPLYSPFKLKSEMMEGEQVSDSQVAVEDFSEAETTSNNLDGTLVNLSESFEKVLSYVTTELKDKNIQLSFDSKKVSYYVKAHTDTLEHIFFNSMVCLMKMAAGTKEKLTQVKVEKRQLGEKLSLRITSSKSDVGINPGDISRDFAIIRSLAIDEGLQFLFEESADQFILAFIFNEVSIVETEAKARRLSLVKKGKKRDLTREFQN
jgi:hypothetical protein